MTTYLSNRDGNGLTNEEGHYRFQTKVWSGNVLSGLLVAANSTPNMTVVVQAGDLKIDYSSYAYTAWNDSNASVTIATADTSNPRIDRIIAYIDRSMTWSGQTNNPGGLKFIAVAGTAAAAPTKASNSVVNTAVSNNPWCELATVNVAANVTQVTGANITDTRNMVTLFANSVGSAQIKDSSITTAKIQDSSITSAKLALSKTTDSNGWIVLDYGVWKEYVKAVASPTASVPAQGAGSTVNFSLPVGMSNLTGAYTSVGFVGTGYDSMRFSYALQTRSAPNYFVEVFNTWTGGALVLTGTFYIRIVK